MRLQTARTKRDRLIAQATDAGATRREVAAAAGLSVGAVQQILKRLGVVAVLVLTLIFATSAQGATLPVGAKQPTACEPTFFGGGKPLRLAAIGATFTGDDDGAWYEASTVETWRRKQQWGAQFTEHRDGRMVVHNIGTRPVQVKCPNSSEALAVAR